MADSTGYAADRCAYGRRTVAADGDINGGFNMQAIRVTHYALPFTYFSYFVFNASYAALYGLEAAMLPVGYFNYR